VRYSREWGITRSPYPSLLRITSAQYRVAYSGLLVLVPFAARHHRTRRPRRMLVRGRLWVFRTSERSRNSRHHCRIMTDPPRDLHLLTMENGVKWTGWRVKRKLGHPFHRLLVVSVVPAVGVCVDAIVTFTRAGPCTQYQVVGIEGGCMYGRASETAVASKVMIVSW
jgi:hypothetical protein